MLVILFAKCCSLRLHCLIAYPCASLSMLALRLVTVVLIQLVFAGDIHPGNITHTIVCRLEALESQNKWFISWNRDDIIRQGEESASRYESGSPLSVLDGVPFCVKDHIDALPYPTTGGTAYLADM